MWNTTEQTQTLSNSLQKCQISCLDLETSKSYDRSLEITVRGISEGDLYYIKTSTTFISWNIETDLIQICHCNCWSFAQKYLSVVKLLKILLHNFTFYSPPCRMDKSVESIGLVQCACNRDNSRTTGFKKFTIQKLL